MNNCFDNQRKKLFAVLVLIQSFILVSLILAGEFSSGMGSLVIRLIFLLAANFCISQNFAVLYSVFAIFSALFLIDPLGLLITGRKYTHMIDGKKTALQNIFCIVAFVLTLVASYVGYLYVRELKKQVVNPTYNNGSSGYGYQPYSQQNQPTTTYGGTNYLYQNPNTGTQNTNTRTAQNQQPRSNFQAFSGEGYSLN